MPCTPSKPVYKPLGIQGLEIGQYVKCFCSHFVAGNYAFLGVLDFKPTEFEKINRTIIFSISCSKKTFLNKNLPKSPFFDVLKGLFYIVMRTKSHQQVTQCSLELFFLPSFCAFPRRSFPKNARSKLRRFPVRWAAHCIPNPSANRLW